MVCRAKVREGEGGVRAHMCLVCVFLCSFLRAIFIQNIQKKKQVKVLTLFIYCESSYYYYFYYEVS